MATYFGPISLVIILNEMCPPDAQHTAWEPEKNFRDIAHEYTTAQALVVLPVMI